MLRIQNLYKRYGDYIALNGLNLYLKKGELLGFVGPNGAGKTTTMRIAAGLLKADSGEIYVDGIDVNKDQKKLKEKIGYMPDFFGVYDNLKVIEYMEFYASMYGIIGNKAKQISMELMDQVNLSDKANDYVDELSRGMKQRLCLARSLVHNPDLLILDEPASGLDPRARVEMKTILKNLSDNGRTIIVSSHILPELAQMCTTIGIIEKGRMVVNGTVDEIMTKLNATNPIIIKVVNNQEEAITLLKTNPLVENISIKENSISIGFLGDEIEEAKLIRTLVENNVYLSSFSREEGDLESLFMQITAHAEQEV
ncbi:ABC transporter ATP-binding protein [Anaeromicropila herbilytica]|uniref:ABC transporter n=1 Tax=Anaeromicropila herbilytica TaxID=2785025 RepID=A0A7R7ENV1_9FIRM|nr:ABC transporter ATP-binding protein [Anaeromicropila herbilytica]BCN32232.1 ABC transporter [Anaeromicropila herbilytica]